MGLFDFLKKSTKPTYDAANIQITDLEVGFIFDYDLTSWEVVEAYKYDWGDEYFSSEYKIFDGSQTLFLSVEDDDEVCLSITQKVKIAAIADNITDIIVKNERPPTKIRYKGIDYHLESENPGYFNKEGTEQWAEFISWNYEDEKGEAILSIERWGDFDFEAAVGKNIEESEIANILPRSK